MGGDKEVFSKSKNEIFQEISELMPTDFEDLDSIGQLDLIIKACDNVLRPSGNWILIDASEPLGNLLSNLKLSISDLLH